jgi:hypothetical protein
LQGLFLRKLLIELFTTDLRDSPVARGNQGRISLLKLFSRFGPGRSTISSYALITSKPAGSAAVTNF